MSDRSLPWECVCGEAIRVPRTAEGQALAERFSQQHEMCDPSFDAEDAMELDRMREENEPVDWLGVTE